MGKIQIENMSFAYKGSYTPVFTKVNLDFDTEWKLGLIGRNGRGKTTLLKLIHGSLEPDEGLIRKNVDTVIFPYFYQGNYRNTLDVIKECMGNLRTLEKNLEDAETLEKYLELEGFAAEGKIKREAKKIGLKENTFTRDFSTLSEGEKTKALLIALFLRPNTFVLLDEPTNHLDEKGRDEVVAYLKKKKGFILVSHDRNFIDEVADHILSINKSNTELEKGNYSSWKNNAAMREEFEKRTSENLVREIANMERHAVKKREWAGVANTQKYSFRPKSARANGAKAYMGQAKRAEGKVRNDIEKKKTLLRNMERAKDLTFFQEETEDWLIRAENLCFSYEKGTALLENISLEIKAHDALWIRGNNGCGKSTLLKLLTGEIPNSFVKYNGVVTFTVLPQKLDIGRGLTGKEYLKQQSMSSEEYEEGLRLCEAFDISEQLLEKPCDLYSSGESKKLVLAGTLSRKNDIIILDEVLNFMDVMFREQLEKAILTLHPTLIFVEHDEAFGEKIATGVLGL